MTTKDIKFWLEEKDLTTPKHDEMVLWAFNNSLKIIEEVLPKESMRIFNSFEHPNFKFDFELEKVTRKIREDYNQYYSEYETECIEYLIKYIKENPIRGDYRDSHIKEKQKKLAYLLTEEKIIPEIYKKFKEEYYTQWALYLNERKKMEYALGGQYNIGFIDLAIFISRESFIKKGFKSFINFDKVNKLKDSTKEEVGIFIEVKPEVKSIGEVLRQISYYRKYLPQDNYFVLLTKTKGLKDLFKSQDIYVIEYESESEIIKKGETNGSLI